MVRDGEDRPAPGSWLRDRPWIWILLLFALVLGVNLLAVWIAGQEPPAPVE
jgi:hypothetical protein